MVLTMFGNKDKGEVKKVRGATVFLRRDPQTDLNCVIIKGKGFQTFKNLESTLGSDVITDSSYDDESGAFKFSICEKKIGEAMPQ